MATVPEVFEVGDDDKMRILQEVPPDALMAQVELAVQQCPKQALSLQSTA
jgi:ferredoxin